jgi:hypothetical protein
LEPLPFSAKVRTTRFTPIAAQQRESKSVPALHNESHLRRPRGKSVTGVCCHAREKYVFATCGRQHDDVHEVSLEQTKILPMYVLAAPAAPQYLHKISLNCDRSRRERNATQAVTPRRRPAWSKLLLRYISDRGLR